MGTWRHGLVLIASVSLTLATIQSCVAVATKDDSAGPVFFYLRPARSWDEALPIGNGSLGAMVFGGVPEERLQLNEDTFWSGGPYDPINPEALEYLPQVRKLLLEGRYSAARQLADEKLIRRPRNLQA